MSGTYPTYRILKIDIDDWWSNVFLLECPPEVDAGSLIILGIWDRAGHRFHSSGFPDMEIPYLLVDLNSRLLEKSVDADMFVTPEEVFGFELSSESQLELILDNIAHMEEDFMDLLRTLK